MENNSNNIPETKAYSFILFIFGMSPKSVNAMENLNHICEHYLKDNFELQIIDISRDEQAAAAHQIIAIPTLIRLNPIPHRTILGDLSNTAKVLQLLEIPDKI